MMNKRYELFRRNFPFIVRSDDEAFKIINDSNNKFIDLTNESGNLIASSIINKNVILMMCVDKEYRKKGIGTTLLNKSEEYIASKGYDNVIIGVGDNYLMPGIPMATKPLEEELNDDFICHDVSDDSYNFFRKRGYVHSWKDANCFDMRVDLDKVNFPGQSIGDIVDGVEYRFANVNDIDKIVECTDDAEQAFSQYYKNKELYKAESSQKVLIAVVNGEVCGTLIISIETEAKGLGSVGCTTVSHKYRGRHIGVNMVVLGTKYLKSLGLKNGYLGYTYSGLDKMYGYAGYKICIYYCMAQKSLNIKRKRLV